MKRFVIAVSAILLSPLVYSADSAGVAGIMNTSGTVEVNEFTNPRNIWTLYVPNDPSEENVLLAYVAYKRVGKHAVMVEFRDVKGNKIDSCSFEQKSIERVPYINTITCKWGGRLPSGGITVVVTNKFEGKNELIGELYIPSKS